jgi:hypothetical protein
VTAFLLAQEQDRLGTIPDWIAALGTVAAFLVALRLLAKELASRREYEEDRRRAQASRVVCWLEIAPTTSTFNPSMLSQPVTRVVGHHLELVLHNGSEEPVFDCRVHVDIDPTRASAKAPDGRRRLRLTERMLPPGRTSRSLDLSGEDLLRTNVWMVFTDASNQRWQRSHTGRLSRLMDRSALPRRSRKDYMNAWIAGELDHLDY